MKKTINSSAKKAPQRSAKGQVLLSKRAGIKRSKVFKKKLFTRIQKSSAQVKKYLRQSVKNVKVQHKHLINALSVGFVLISLIFGQYLGTPFKTSGASFTFVQNSWTGGADATSTASHPDNQAGWNKFSSSTNILAGATISLAASSATTTVTDDTNSNVGFNLTGGSFASTTVVGTGDSASVKLTVVSTTTFGANWSQFPAANFSYPTGVATDMVNNKTYVADYSNLRIVRFDSGSGGTTYGANWQTLGSWGYGVNQFSGISDVAVDSTNNKTYVSDLGNSRIVRFDSGSGGTTFGANWQTFGNYGSGSNQFYNSSGITIDTINNKTYVSDLGNSRIVRFDSGSGGTTFGANWQTFGTLGSGVNQFNNARNIIIDTVSNKITVSDASNNRIVRFDSGSGGTTFGANWETFGAIGSGSNQFNSPSGVTIDTTNNKTYAVDTNNRRIVRFDSGSGGTTFGANWETFGTLGSGVNQFNGTKGIAIDTVHNKVIVADASNNRIALFDSGGGGTTLGSNWSTLGGAGSGVNQFYGLQDVVVDPTNNKIYTVDSSNNRIVRFDSGSGGTIYGANWQTFGTSGSGVNQFSGAEGITIDFTNNKIYVAEFSNNRIARFDSGSGGTTFGANWQTFGSYGSGANQFRGPYDVTIDSTNNNIYVADASNNRIARFDSGSGGTTFGANWQTFGTSGSGVNQFSFPSGVTVDLNNKVYITDGNKRIARFDSGSGGTTFGANWETFGTSGSGANQFSNPVGVNINSTNNKVYVADVNNYRISSFDSGSGGTTFGANWQTFGSSGSGENHFTGPIGVVSDVTNNKIYATDSTRIAQFDSGGSIYNTSGSYTSGAINLAASSWGNLSFVNSGASQTSVSIKARSSATSDFSGASAWGSCASISNGAALSTGNCVTNGHAYIQYQATLSTTVSAASPSLDSVSIGYLGYATSGNLISSAYDSADPTNVMGTASWTEDSTSTFSLRTASTTALLFSASWTDLTATSTGCSKAGSIVTCLSAALPGAMQASGFNRYFEYKLTLTSTGASTPSISNVAITYVVNAPPEFNSAYNTTGVSASQIATSSDPSFGKVQIQYSVRDTDTVFGNPQTGTPGFVTPSFQYSTNGGSSWTDIASQYLNPTDTINKSVSTSTFITYSAFWDAKSQVSGLYAPTLQVRVNITDNEVANAIAHADATLSADTKIPLLTASSIDVSSRTVSVTLSDDSSFQFTLTNNADASSTDNVNASSGIFQAGVSGAPVVFNNWTFNTGDSAFVYGTVIDRFGNSTSIHLVAPGIPSNMDLKDTSNPAIDTYREFLSWKLYTSTSSATFAKYDLYRSTGGTFTHLADVTNINQNYYTDSSVSSSTTYAYKVRVVDTDGDVSDYSAIVSDNPDGQGGTDFTAPTISAISVSDKQPTWAKITWTTDEISDSRIEYSATEGVYSTPVTSIALVTDHSVVLQSLLPNTTYYYRVKSKDPLNNESVDSGHSFTTPGGPAISAVAIPSVSDREATISWNTDILSDSYVIYATDIGNLISGAGITTIGSATTTTAHVVSISALSPRTKYYFYVQSTDPVTGYTSLDNNAGNYYYLGTTYDMVPPVISNISTPVISQTSAVIVWQTDELSTGQANYGTTLGSYDKSTVADNTLSIYHVATLRDLSASTDYYFKVVSLDAAGNMGSSTESSVRTSDPGDITIVQNIVSGGGSAPPPITDTAPPTITNITSTDSGAFEAKINFATDESATGIVKVGEDTSYGKIFGEDGYSTSHVVNLFGLKLGTTYHYLVKASDKSGNVGVGTDRTFQTKYLAEATQDLHTIQNAEEFQSQLDNLITSFLPSLAAPFVGPVSVTDVTDTAATITWTTNAKTYGSVVYAPASNYELDKAKPYSAEVSESQGKAAAHQIILAGLSPATLYHFSAHAFVFPEVVGSSADNVFTTMSAKIVPAVTNLTNTGFTVSWSTSKESTSYVEYRDVKTGKLSQVGSAEYTKAHVVQVTDLTPNSTYTVKAYGKDRDGISAEGVPVTVILKRDIVPPQILGVSMSNTFIPNRPDQLQTIISWKTDKPSNSIVNYEEGLGTSDVLANTVGERTDLTLQHNVIIPGFKPGTVYRFRVLSTDQSGNTGQAPIRTVVTPTTNQSVFDVIVKNFEDVFGVFGGR